MQTVRTMFYKIFPEFFSFFALLVVMSRIPSSVFAGLSYNGGTYTNLCGTGLAATQDSCQKGCNTGTGTCTSSGANVVKWTCDGNTTDCRGSEQPFASSYTLGTPGCGKTVQLDVFNKNCRAGGGWNCGDTDLLDYMVWYSGDCGSTIPVCDASQLNLQATPNPVTQGNTITFSASGSQGSTWIDDLFSGGVSCAGPIWGNKSCSTTTTGTFTWTHKWRNCAGSTSNCGDVCSKSLGFSITSTSTTPTPTPTITPTPTPTPTSSCDSLSVASGNNGLVPATVTLRARGSDSAGSILRYRFFFGDGKQEETANTEITHRYESSGTFTSRLDIQDSRGAWKSSNACETTVTVKSLPIESHKSGCSNLFIRDGNNGQAPVTGKFEVTGFDNKGALQEYRIDFGNGITKDSTGNTFEQVYSSPGTYTARGYIKNSAGNWQGGTDSCQQTFYAATKPLTSQPGTGTPTVFTILGIAGGIVASLLFLFFKLAPLGL